MDLRDFSFGIHFLFTIVQGPRMIYRTHILYGDYINFDSIIYSMVNDFLIRKRMNLFEHMHRFKDRVINCEIIVKIIERGIFIYFDAFQDRIFQ